MASGSDVKEGAVETTPAAARPRIFILNAALAGAEGNTARWLARARAGLAQRVELDVAVLAGPGAETFASLEERLRAADGFWFATGTHWDGWSSPLQRFLEDATPAECTELWLGKPAAVLVTEHSAGGKGVLSRLQGVLVTLGCAIPPCSGLVLAQSALLARRHAPEEAEDYWGAEDLGIVAHNLCTAAARRRADWRAWPVDRKDFRRVWAE
jgi:chromate reductase